MAVKTIRLIPGRQERPTPPVPSYEFRAPLDAEGKLDREAWPAEKELCVVRKFIDGVQVQSGLLQHTQGGKWVFSYEKGLDDDETIFRLSSHTFVPGEYISITDHDGGEYTFQVSTVEPWHPIPNQNLAPARWPRT